MKIKVACLFLFLGLYTFGQVSLTVIDGTYSQNFNTLANSGTSSTMPTGWVFSESGTGTNSTYTAGNGSGNTGDTYSFGPTSNTERALGGLQSGSLIPLWGAGFTNNTGSTITSLDISYTGETWRIGTASRTDGIDFQISTSATSITTGTWTDQNSLDYFNPGQALASGSMLHSSTISSTISSLNIAPGATFWIRWNDFNATSSDDGLGIDNFSVIPHSAIANTITTTTLSGNPFTVDCNLAASGTIDFTSTGTFTAGNIYTAQLSNAAGSFASPVSIGTLNSIANNGTINITIPTGTAGGTTYRIRVVSSNPAITGTNNGSDFTITLNPCSISTGSVSSLSFSVDCTADTDDFGTVDFTSSGTFDPGNNYIAQLSDATGSFASPTTIGSLASSLNSGTITITIPSSLATSTLYRIRVVSTSPVLTGTNNGSNITITQTAPCLPTLPTTEGLLINEFSNGSTTEKEYYEFVVAGQCGAIVDIRGYIIDDNNGTFSAVFPSTSGIAPGHLKLSDDTQWQFIPVGSLIVVYNADDVNSDIPADDPNDSDFDSLFVIPHNHPTLFDITTELPSNAIPDSTYSPIVSFISTQWAPLSLRNAGDAVQVRTPSGDYFHGVSYGGAELTGGPNNMKITTLGMGGMCGWFNDGDIFNASNWSTGTVASSQTPGLPNNAANLAWLRAMRDPTAIDCPITVLPSTAVNLSANYINTQSQIDWQTSSELNNDHFTLSHSTDGKHFATIGTIEGAGNSNELINYRFIHKFPHPGWNYYKLQSTDYDGTTYNKGIVSLEAEFNFSYYNSNTQSIELFYTSDIEIYSVDGKLVESAKEVSSLSFNRSGLFILLDKRTGITERLFIP